MIRRLLARLRKLLHLGLYLGFRICETVVRLFPIEWVFVIGSAGGEIAYLFLRKRRKLAFTNLSLALGQHDNAQELRTLNRRHFRTLGANLLCCLKIATMREDRIFERVTVEKPSALEVPPEQERAGWVAMISHLGNWELFGHLTALLPEYHFGAIYQRLANPYMDKHLRKLRSRAAIDLFDRREAYLRSVDFLRKGNVLGILVDQSAGYPGVWMPLFNRLASCSTLPAALATRTGTPILPIAIYTRGVARWHIVLSEPIYSDSDDIELLTSRVNCELE